MGNGTEKRSFDFPVVGKQTLYLTGHDELHSLSQNIDANSIRFWMGFSDHYINCFTVLKNTGLLSEQPVRTAEGVEIRAIEGGQGVPAGPRLPGAGLHG